MKIRLYHLVGLAAVLAALLLLSGCARPMALTTPTPVAAPTTSRPAAPTPAPTRAAPTTIAQTMEAWWSPGGEPVLVLRPEPLVVVGRCYGRDVAQIAMPEGQSVWVPRASVPPNDYEAAPYAPGDCAPPPPAPAAPAVDAPAAAPPTEPTPAPRPTVPGCGAAGVRRCAP